MSDITKVLAEIKELIRCMDGNIIARGRVEDCIHRIEAAMSEPVAWISGYPPHPWDKEWFIAKTTYGDKVVLIALPEVYTYDYKTADDTYIKKEKIAAWMQFPDSEYIKPDAQSQIDKLTRELEEVREKLVKVELHNATTFHGGPWEIYGGDFPGDPNAKLFWLYRKDEHRCLGQEHHEKLSKYEAQIVMYALNKYEAITALKEKP